MTIQKLKTPQDFLSFFQAIPEDRWCTGAFSHQGKSCALGHLKFDQPGYSGLDSPGSRLISIFKSHRRWVLPSLVNDDGENRFFPGKTPKERICNFLRDIINRHDDKDSKV